MSILIGTAGIPHSTKKSGTVEGIKRVAELGLTATEIEFVRGIYMTPELAKKVKETATKNKIALTVHAPYYINLNSPEEAKIKASVQRILKSAKIGNLAGATSVTFHPAYYMKKDPKEVYEIVKAQLIEMVAELKKENNPIRVSPETTGKVSQFGELKELLQLAKEIKQVWLCIDFAHLHARSNGKFNSKREFDAVFDTVKDYLGAPGLSNLHMHVSGINYGAKGEKNHLQLPNSDFNIKALIESMKENKISGILIAESPNPEKDALLIQELLTKA